MDKELAKIEEARKEMIRLAMELGLDHPYVIELSRLLDQMHNQWNSKQRNNPKYPNELKECRVWYIYIAAHAS